MESSPYIVEARPENFRPLVLGNSRKGPVLVFYWSPNAGPCVRLLPRLVKLAGEFGGRFLLALLDIDEYTAFAQEQGVISIPTVRVYFREKIAETIRGAYSEQLFRGVLVKYLPKLVSAVQQEAAARAIKMGNIEQAITHLQACLAQQRDNARLALDLAKLLLREGRHNEAADVIDVLPARRRGARSSTSAAAAAVRSICFAPIWTWSSQRKQHRHNQRWSRDCRPTRKTILATINLRRDNCSTMNLQRHSPRCMASAKTPTHRYGIAPNAACWQSWRCWARNTRGPGNTRPC